MKKTVSIFLIILLLILTSCTVYGTEYQYENEPYTFEISYTGSVMVGETKDADIKLVGVNGPPYSNVQIRIDITGPGTPRIMATDSLGVEHDIAQLGHWGPPGGFAIGGDFTNTTPVRVTFDVAGTYEISLYLVDLNTGDTVITRRDIFIEVLSEQQETNEVNQIEELPKTGTSMWEYLAYSILAIAIFGIGYTLTKKGSYES